MESPIAKQVRTRERLEQRVAQGERDAEMRQIADDGFDLENPKGYTTTRQFLDELRAQPALKSDYQIAKRVGVTPQRVSNWRTGRSTFDDKAALKVAALLDTDAGYILACMAAERTTRPDVRRAWASVAKKLSGAAALIVVAALLAPFSSDLSTAMVRILCSIAAAVIFCAVARPRRALSMA